MDEEDQTSSIEDLESLSDAELTREYLRQRRVYRNTLKRAKHVSRATGGIYVEGNRMAYASVLFTRICVSAQSISLLLPDCKPREHWDFSTVASLARNLFEAYLWYFWLCEDEVDPEVRNGRFILLYCHDYGSRAKMTGAPEPDAQDPVKADLIKQFDNNTYLKSFSDKARREALRGQKTPFIQDDVLGRMGADTTEIRILYRFFSQHTHTGPVSFFRILREGHDRGRGVETTLEKRFMIPAVMFADAILLGAIDGHLKLFPAANDAIAPNVQA